MHTFPEIVIQQQRRLRIHRLLRLSSCLLLWLRPPSVMQTLSLLALALSWPGLASASAVPRADSHQAASAANNAHLFASPDLAIAEAPAAGQLTIGSHPSPDVLNSPMRARVQMLQEMAAAQALQRRRRRRWTGWLRRGSHEHALRAVPTSSNATTNTLYSGVYPVINVTWGNKAGAASASQTFVSYIDTGSSDTFAVSKNFACLGAQTQTAGVDVDGYEYAATAASSRSALSQASCRFGPLYDTDQGNFSNITTQAFSISYFPEMESLAGSMVLAPITVGGLTVPQQQVAVVESAVWTGDGIASGLLGLSYPALTAAQNRRTGLPAPAYVPFFTNLARQGANSSSNSSSSSSSSSDPEAARAAAVFALAVDRVPHGTPFWKAAGMLALGGLVPASYYEGNFTSVPIEPPWTLPATSSLRAFYATTVQVVYGPPGTNGTYGAGGTGTTPATAAHLSSSPSFQTIVDSGTAPNFVPSGAAAAINRLFDPPATFNKTLNYYTVDCNAKAPYVAFRIGGGQTVAGRPAATGCGVLMPVDPQDMIVRSLNGLPGFDDVCFSSVADGGSQYNGQLIIGSTWQRSYVVVYDQGRSMLHFAKRRPY